MKVLAIETSGDICGAALISGDGVVSEKNILLPKNSSSGIFEIVKEISSKTDYDYLAVDIGPGSFTGIRIGVSFARAYGQFLKIPVAGISSLDCLVFNAVFKHSVSGKIYPVIDALREELYTAEYCGMKRKKEYQIITIEKFKKMLNSKHTIVGSRKICEKIGKDCINIQLTASAIGLLAAAVFMKKGIVASYKDTVPLYIRRAFAEERAKI